MRNALLGPDREVWYLAQTGKDSNEQFRKLIKSVVCSPLAALIDGNPRMSNGSMALPLVNGSTLRPGSMTESAPGQADSGWLYPDDDHAHEGHGRPSAIVDHKHGGHG